MGVFEDRFGELQKFLDDLENQPKYIGDYISQINHLLDQSIDCITCDAQKSILSQYVDDYKSEALTPLNMSLDNIKLKVADTFMYWAASCAIDDPKGFPVNFADQVREVSSPLLLDKPNDISDQLQSFYNSSSDNPATRIDDGVSDILNEVENVFVRDFSRRLDDYLGVEEKLALVIE